MAQMAVAQEIQRYRVVRRCEAIPPMHESKKAVFEWHPRSSRSETARLRARGLRPFHLDVLFVRHHDKDSLIFNGEASAGCRACACFQILKHDLDMNLAAAPARKPNDPTVGFQELTPEIEWHTEDDSAMDSTTQTGRT
ncbi:MAG: hypothetical protein QM723_12940 [Myxococcaceae bacterium]